MFTFLSIVLQTKKHLKCSNNSTVFFYDDDDDLPNFEIKLYPEITEEPGPNEEELEENRDSSQEIDSFIQNEKSLNTVKKTQVDWRKLESFCNEKTDGRFNITTIPFQDLDKLLCHFFKDVRKKTGEEYEPDTLSSFHRSIQRRVGKLKLPFNILKDEVFCRSRQVLAAKRKNLVKQGKGNRPNATRELEDEEEEKLFESGEFGLQDPVALQRTLWWFLSMHFGFRAMQRRKQKTPLGRRKAGQRSTNKRGVLVWATERGSKTRQGLDGGHWRVFNHRWPKLPICVGNDYSGVRLHIAILSKCMGNLNSSHNVMKNNKIHCLPQASCVVVTPCVYGGFWSRLEAN